jgi:hypothetical protein
LKLKREFKLRAQTLALSLVPFVCHSHLAARNL